MKEFFILGIDLAGIPSRPTGVCLLCWPKAKTLLLYSDEEILAGVETESPDLVTAAYVGLLFLKGEAEIYGDFSSGAIIMPFPSE